MDMKCPVCGQNNIETAAVCDLCGAALTSGDVITTYSLSGFELLTRKSFVVSQEGVVTGDGEILMLLKNSSISFGYDNSFFVESADSSRFTVLLNNQVFRGKRLIDDKSVISVNTSDDTVLAVA